MSYCSRFILLQASALLQTDQLKEGVTLIRESSLAKRSPDLKGVCSTILSNLSGLVIIALRISVEMKTGRVYILIYHDYMRTCT